VGSATGESVGLRVGLLVVGASVGTAVGAAVGANSHEQAPSLEIIPVGQATQEAGLTAP